MNCDLVSTDRLIHEKFKSARRGLVLWKKIRRTLHFKQEDTLIFQPNGYNDESVYSLTCIKQLILTHEPKNIYFVTTNPKMEKFVPLFAPNAKILIIDDLKSHDMMNYVLMSQEKPNIYIASFTEPFGRMGDRMIKYGHIGPEHCLAIGEYRVWHYVPSPIPKYFGNDVDILNFLERAKLLQEKSLKIEMSAAE